VTRALVIVLALAGVASADTGGRMGGGNWSSSGSSPSSGGSHYAGGGGGGGYTGGFSASDTPSSSWPSSPDTSFAWQHDDSMSSSSSSGEPFNPYLFGIFIVCAIAMLWWWHREDRDFGKPSPTVSLAKLLAHNDVSVIRIALDGRSRPFVQRELARIAGVADTATDAGRAMMLHELALMLRRLRGAWVYGGAVNEPLRDLDATKAAFDRLVDDARARFREETISNEQGVKTTTTPSQYTPRSDEGPGLVLVSMIIAARSELFTVGSIASGVDLSAALDAASHLEARNLLAIEIVWQPSEDADRMSSMELEAKYPAPELVKIDGALVGKKFCDHCGGPYPAECVSCPHCGAPAWKEAA
jgi:uncharacterized membrane protein